MTYALTTYSDDFDLVLDDYGEYVITLDGSVRDIYGDTFSISGEYSVFIAEMLDIETGVFPGTPFEVGDQFSSSVIVQPGVPAEVTVTLQHYPNSIKNDRIETFVSGVANRFGYFSPNQAALHLKIQVNIWRIMKLSTPRRKAFCGWRQGGGPQSLRRPVAKYLFMVIGVMRGERKIGSGI